MIISRMNRTLPRRTAAALLVLVLMVLLVVVGATKTLLTGELLTRRGESNRLRMASMEAAINTARTLSDQPSGKPFTELRLPIDADTDQFIEITVNTDKKQFVARWHQGERVIEEMNRQIEESQSESGQ